jgi:serine/threonine protein kinase
MPALARPSSAPARSGLGSPWPAVLGYALVKQLAAGRWCDVYLARPYDLSCGSADYVVKTIRAASTEREFARALLQREATVAVNVAHPNLISLLDARFEEENPVLVFPFTPGSLLADLVRSPRPVSVPQALWYFRQAAAALAELHAQGWLHGDVKPHNLIVSDQGHVTLIDLGLARRIDSAECRADRWLAGDSEYLAPEAFIPSSQLTTAADMYSLGLTLLRLLLGDRFSSGADHPDRRKEISQLRAQRPDVSREVAALITRMTAIEPLRRPTANELVDALTRLEIESLMQW